MKPFFIALIIILPFCLGAQNINIPDVFFKQSVVADYDTSGDGEIQVGEALSIRNLRVYTFYNLVGSNMVERNPEDLTGIETFANLERLIIDAHGTRYVNLNHLENLRSIKINPYYQLNDLTKLNITGCTNLDSLQVYGDNFLLDTIDVSSCTNLRFLECYSLNRLKALTLQGCTNLKVLRLGMIGPVNISGLVNLEEFSFGSDGDPTIDFGFGNFNNLRKVYISGAWVLNADFSQCFNLDTLSILWAGFSHQFLNLSNSPHLKLLELTKGFLMDSTNRLTTLNLKNGTALGRFYFDSALHIQYLCADDFEVDTFRQYFTLMNQHPNINSSCLFSPVPVKLEYFTVNKKDNANLLHWKASCSYGNASFAIERSDDGIHFSSIGNINATAVRCQLPFNFTDNNPASGKNYYRLKITDADGKSFYSKTLVVANNKAGLEITAVANNTVYLNSNKQQTITFKVITVDGKTLYTGNKMVNSGNSNINLLMERASGIFTLIVYTTEGNILIRKFVKQ